MGKLERKGESNSKNKQNFENKKNMEREFWSEDIDQIPTFLLQTWKYSLDQYRKKEWEPKIEMEIKDNKKKEIFLKKKKIKKTRFKEW